eukprot:TRINITY_DN3640_c0_g1_i1.p1 TRINITY_DN3640_c0_g1~~TRINITY_DN3640_c0_g1_i1.p1  ORF type:complete len:720 (+),score=129.50 TRINITY_DN3640_c0_g1_i1:31-2190(+)
MEDNRNKYKKEIIEEKDDIPKLNYESAAAFIDASFNRRYAKALIDHLTENNNPKIIRYYRLYQNLYYLRVFTSFFLFILSFFERPSWCYHTDCNVPRDPSKIMPNTTPIIWFSSWPIISPNLGLSLELVCLILIFINTIVMGIMISGFIDQFKKRWVIIETVAIFVSIIDIIVSFCINRTWRLSQFLRAVVLVMESPKVKRLCKNIAYLIPRLSEILFILGLSVFAYSWVGTVLWFDVPNQSNYNTIRNSLSSTQIMLTTVNNPDVMIPFYSQSYWAFLFNITFYLVTYFLIFQLTLIVTVEGFSKSVSNDLVEMESRRKKCIVIAFKYLDIGATGYINFTKFKNLLLELQRYHRSSIPKQKYFKHIYYLLSAKRNGDVNMRQFTRINQFLGIHFLSKKAPKLHRTFKIFQTAPFRAFFSIAKSSYFSYFFYIMIIMDLVMTMIETAKFLNGESNSGAMDIVELIFSIAYLFEVFSKILAMGWVKFNNDFTNQCDLVIVLICFGLEIAFSSFIPSSHNVRILIISRLLRVIRLLYQIETYRFLMIALARTFPLFSSLIILWGINISFFCFVGMVAFGGRIFEGNVDLQTGPFVGSNYFCYNFNDFPNSFVLSFAIQINNNWNNLMDGVERSSSGYARFFQICYWILTIVINMNVLCALIIRVLVPTWHKLKEGKKHSAYVFFTHSYVVDTGTGEFDDYSSAGDEIHDVSLEEKETKNEK